MDARIEALVAAVVAQGAGQATSAAAKPGPDGAEPRPDFRWLAAPTATVPVLMLPLLATFPAWERSVFIPVFLATGLVVTVAASGVERLSALRAGTTTVALPTPLPAPEQTGKRRAREALNGISRRTLVVVPIVVMLLGSAVAGALYYAVHDWSKTVGPGVTTLTVEVGRKGGPDVTDLESTETIGRYCALKAGALEARYQGVSPGPDGAVLLRLTPLLDSQAQRRYVGCVEDSVLDAYQFRVTATKLAPAGKG